MIRLFKAYAELARKDPGWAYFEGVALYLVFIQLPCLVLAHPDGKSQALLIAGCPLFGVMTMAWARWSALPKTVPQHETIEEEHK